MQSAAPTTVPGDSSDAPAPNNGPPSGVEAKYFNTNTLERYGMVIDTDVDAKNRWKRLDKAKILEDIQEQGVINDFHSLKQQIEELPGDDILVVFDPEERFMDTLVETEANFYVCLTNESRTIEEEAEKAANEPDQAAEAKTVNDGFQPDDLAKYLSLHEPVPHEWASQGSEAEVNALTVHTTRPLMGVSLSRTRRDFGAPYKLSDRDAHDSLYEYRPFKDPNFETGLVEEDTDVQAVPVTHDIDVQTTWRRQVHVGAQYVPQSLPDDERERRAHSPTLQTLSSDACVDALKQNVAVDVYTADYTELGVDEAPIGTSADSTMKEEPSFTDLKYSKDKIIAAIDAMPQGAGVIAVSCAVQRSFNDHVESSGHVEAAAILIWNFLDPIHPQHVLIAPTDVTAFKFNPMQPSLLAGGTISGQALLWDLGSVVDELLNKDTSVKREVSESVVQCSVVSAIATSHRTAVTDVSWLPSGMDIDETGRTRRASKSESEAPRQFVTISTDGYMLIWDTHFSKPLFEVDLAWSPKHSIALTSEGSMLRAQRLELDENGFLCTTEDGQVVVGDFRDRGTVRRVFSGQRGATPVLARSPFFPNTYLTAGDWTFMLWRDGVETPLLVSPYAHAFITCAVWSPTRPAVFFTGRSDGLVDAWDLSDKSHAPTMSQTIVSGSSVTALQFAKAPDHTIRTRTVDMLMVGDDMGVVHPMTVPRSLARPMPAEKGAMEAFLSREVSRVTSSEAITDVSASEPERSTQMEQERRIMLDAEQREVVYRQLETSFKRKFEL